MHGYQTIHGCLVHILRSRLVDSYFLISSYMLQWLPLHISYQYAFLHACMILGQFFVYVGKPVNFSVVVTPQRRLPLDLYVLMDLSASVVTQLQGLKVITGDIGDYYKISFIDYSCPSVTEG